MKNEKKDEKKIESTNEFLDIILE